MKIEYLTTFIKTVISVPTISKLHFNVNPIQGGLCRGCSRIGGPP